MSEKRAQYITTTLPYVNADPHIGFALEVIQADTLARYYRLMGHEVFFNTGTDEHGQKIAQVADAEGKPRQTYVDEYAAKFNQLKEALNLSNDAFIRTTDEAHKAAAQEIWRRCAKKGDVYKKSYTGLYCVGCELFYKESELDENKCCLIHGKPVQEVEEENYFFKLSNYESALIEMLSDEKRVVPNWQRQWALDFVKGGLEDLSISRQKSRMDWGVPVPDDSEHVMYVWFDALTNYISTLGWPNEGGNFEKFWKEGNTLQLAGKDQVRFQSIIFQAMLMSADIKTTDVIYYHGFINTNGQKMSKSLGNVISPYEMVAKYGTDATRYILLRHVHPFDDSDITWEKMDEWYTANLVNGLGNLVSRVMKMAETHLKEPVKIPNVSIKDDLGVGLLHIGESFDFQKNLDDSWAGIKTVTWFADVTKPEEIISAASIKSVDEIIQAEEPFKKIKSNNQAEVSKAIEMIELLVTQIWYKAIELESVMPATSRIIKEAVLQNKKPDNLFPRLEI